VVAAIGERTAKDARSFGVRVDLVLPIDTDAMVEAIVESLIPSN
jgi:uroporphyrinogen-III synthase